MDVKEFWTPYVSYWKKILDFEGKTTRKDYWMVVLANLLISAVTGVLMTIPFVSYIVYVLDSLYGVAVILPSIAIGVRRLHDTNRSGLWLLLGFIPIVGIIILIVWFCEPSATSDAAATTTQPTNGDTVVVNSDSVNPGAKPADAEVVEPKDNKEDNAQDNKSDTTTSDNN